MGIVTSREIKWLLAALGIFVAIAQPGYGIPAFARKYGLPCSACHEAWPMLNNFGQTFKDNGYQLGNGRDAPIYQEPSYWPIMFRTTTVWHRESNNRQAVDSVPGNPASGLVEAGVSSSGFDLLGVDAITAGTLYNNISFFIQPFIGNNSITVNQSWVRLDNLLGSPWLNFKMGKFEVDQPLSQQRLLTISNTGGIYYNYFFTPPGDRNTFGGIGFPQLGAELLGHSGDDETRYSVAVVSSNSGQTGLPTNQTYDLYVNFDQAFILPWFGRQQIGAYSYFGQAPTFFQTSGGTPIPGTGMGNRSFYRAGLYAHWYVGSQVDLDTFYMHGHDNVFLGNGVPANQPSKLPPGAVGPSWNGGYIEGHYNPNTRLIFVGRYELIRMEQQANPSIRPGLGNLDTWTVGYRWYPFMSPRAGLAWLQEYSRISNIGAAPLSGKDDMRDSLLMGFDFDF
jgi:hypothetical protein